MNTITSTRHAVVGDTVSIGGEIGTVNRVQNINGLRIVYAGSRKVEADGEGSLLVEVIEHA